MIKLEPPYIPALRFNNLVYVRNFKCASTFFYENFYATFGWHMIDYNNIDWDNDFVFGHIIDPIERRHKGIAEYINMMNLSEEFINNKKLQNLLQTTPYLDRHSLLYSLTFGDKCNDIHWIPLSTHQESINRTEKLLKSQIPNINLADWDYNFDHVSSTNSDKKKVEKILATIWSYKLLYTREIEKFNAVTKNEAWANFYNTKAVDGWPVAPTVDNFITLPLYIRMAVATNETHNISVSPDYTQLTIKPPFENHIASTDIDLYAADIELYQRALSKYE